MTSNRLTVLSRSTPGCSPLPPDVGSRVDFAGTLGLFRARIFRSPSSIRLPRVQCRCNAVSFALRSTSSCMLIVVLMNQNISNVHQDVNRNFWKSTITDLGSSPGRLLPDELSPNSGLSESYLISSRLSSDLSQQEKKHHHLGALPL